MAYPAPIVDCETCDRRFILDPGALVEDVFLELIQLLCRDCRDDGGSEPGVD